MFTDTKTGKKDKKFLDKLIIHLDMEEKTNQNINLGGFLSQYKIAGEENSQPRHIVLETKLIIRKSCGARKKKWWKGKPRKCVKRIGKAYEDYRY